MTEPLRCLTCGNSFERTPGKLGRPPVYCSSSCQKRRPRSRPEPSPRACSVCGKDFTPLRLGARAQYCKQRCRDVARGVVRATPLPERVCEHKPCGASFVPVSELQRRCSERCTRALHKRLAAKRAGWTDQRRDADHRRRALKAGAATGEPVRRAAIAERDAWVCHLCSEPVRPELAHPDPWSASLDHVVPLSRGGAHDPANVRLAHLRCNVRKGAALLEEVPA